MHILLLSGNFMQGALYKIEGEEMNTTVNRNRADEYDEQDDVELSKQIGRNLFVNVKKSYCYDYHLDGAIGAKQEYRQLFQLLYNANSDDIVRFFIGGPGGDLDTTLEIINAVNCTDATVVGILTGSAASAHGILALAMPTLQVCERARLMIHNASAGNYGKLQEITSAVGSTVKTCHDLFDEVYSGFLTEGEMKDLFIGKDFYFDSDEIMKRLKRREDYHKKMDKARKDKAKVVKPKKTVAPKQL